jgi:Domain of unknown function (DUF6473)
MIMRTMGLGLQHFWGGPDRMPMTYQERDFEAIDYAITDVPGAGELRGPVPSDLSPGAYAVCLGAAQTFGCFCDEPYPALLQRQLGIPMLNLGFPGPGPRFFTRKPGLMRLVNQARFAIVQALSGRSVECSYFACPLDRGSLIPRALIGTRPPIDALTAWKQLIEEKGSELAFQQLAETRANWIAQSRELLDSITVPKVLFYFSTRMPRYRARTDSILEFMNDFPQFVTDVMLEAIKPAADGYVEAISSIGLPQRLVSRFNGQPLALTVGYQAPPGYQTYYPSPEMQRLACDMLIPELQRLGLCASGISHSDSAPALRNGA